MFGQITVIKGRTKILPMAFGYDVSNDEIVSQIRVAIDRSSELIAEWDVSFVTDGTDGEVVFKLDDSVTNTIEHSSGWMDVKRISAGEPLSAFDDPIEVIFTESVTA